MLNSGIRRFALSMVIAVVAVASCVKDTLKETNNGSAIDFRVATLTRAVESTAANIETFYVTARIPGVENNYFTDIPYLRGAGDVFHSSESYYWPAAGDLQFYAYCPSLDKFGSEAELEISANSQKVTNFVTASSFENQKDFVVATKYSTKENGKTGVELQFEHKLSQIEVHAKNANPGYKYSIKGIMIGGMASKGDFNFTPLTGEAEWVVDDEADPVLVYEKYDDSKDITSFATNIMGPGGNAMLIPQQLTPFAEKAGSFIAVYAQVRTAEGALVYPRPINGDNNSYNWLVVPIDTEWQSGYKYIYTLDFSNGAGTDFYGVPVLGDKIHFAVDEVKWNPTASIQSTAADFVGTWDIMKCESWRTYYLESNDVPQSVKDYMNSWPPYALYDTDEELSQSGVIGPEMRRTRVIRKDDTFEIQLYPGVDGWETNLNFRIEGDFLYITAYYNGVPIQETKYIIIDYTKDTFTVYSGELNEREDELTNFTYDYFMEKIFYYKKVSDNESGRIDGNWKLDRGTYFPVNYDPRRINIENVDSRLKYLDITLEENGTGLLNGDAITIENNEFTLDSTTYTFTDVRTSTMLVKYDYNGSDVGYLYYSRIE